MIFPLGAISLAAVLIVGGMDIANPPIFNSYDPDEPVEQCRNIPKNPKELEEISIESTL